MPWARPLQPTKRTCSSTATPSSPANARLPSSSRKRRTGSTRSKCCGTASARGSRPCGTASWQPVSRASRPAGPCRLQSARSRNWKRPSASTTPRSSRYRASWPRKKRPSAASPGPTWQQPARRWIKPKKPARPWAKKRAVWPHSTGAGSREKRPWPPCSRKAGT